MADEAWDLLSDKSSSGDDWSVPSVPSEAGETGQVATVTNCIPSTISVEDKVAMVGEKLTTEEINNTGEHVLDQSPFKDSCLNDSYGITSLENFDEAVTHDDLLDGKTSVLGSFKDDRARIDPIANKMTLIESTPLERLDNETHPTEQFDAETHTTEHFDTETHTTEQFDTEETPTKSKVPNIRAAAAAGGLVGLILGGPVLAVMGAVGAGIASTSNCPAGNIARAGGDVAASIGETIVEFNDKHKISEKARVRAEKLGQKIKEVDQDHKITDKVKRWVEHIKQQVKDSDDELGIIETLKSVHLQIFGRTRSGAQN